MRRESGTERICTFGNQETSTYRSQLEYPHNNARSMSWISHGKSMSMKAEETSKGLEYKTNGNVCYLKPKVFARSAVKE